jgi:hypothetical protein
MKAFFRAVKSVTLRFDFLLALQLHLQPHPLKPAPPATCTALLPMTIRRFRKTLIIAAQLLEQRRGRTLAQLKNPCWHWALIPAIHQPSHLRRRFVDRLRSRAPRHKTFMPAPRPATAARSLATIIKPPCQLLLPPFTKTY